MLELFNFTVCTEFYNVLYSAHQDSLGVTSRCVLRLVVLPPCFFHCSNYVMMLQHPNVSPLLGSFLPPVLWMLEDHTDYHRTLALSLISHLIIHMV